MFPCNRRTLGQRGEEAAIRYLRDQGFWIRERNWRRGTLEIDLIAERWDTLHFVEVKTRRAGSWQSSAEAINAAKIRALAQAMRDYTALHRLPLNVQFDVCAITAHPTGHLDIDYIPNAFHL